MEKMKPSDPDKSALPPTEESRHGARAFDALAPREMVRAMNEEDARLPSVIARHEETIARVMVEAARVFAENGRLIYMGSGTSGRLGVLDAAECPPTFGSDPDTSRWTPNFSTP